MGIGVLFLLLWLQLTAAWCIVAADWTRGLEVLPGLAIIAFAIGFLLALSRWPPFLAHLYSLLTGSSFSFAFTSLALPENLEWRARLMNLGWRVHHWLRDALAGEARGDPIAFVLLVSLTVWWSAYLAVWWAMRERNGWQAVIPGGAVIAVNTYYGPPALILYPIAYTFGSLLFILWLHFREQEESWARHRVGFSPYASFDFFRYGLAFILLALLLAWIAPGAKIQSGLGAFREGWEKVQKEWNRLFPSLKGYRSPKVGRAAFGKELSLGGPIALGDMVVMEVEAYPREMARYWKAASYDFYTGRGWVNTDNTAFPFEAWEELPVFTFEMRKPFTQTYYYVEPEGRLIFASSQPLSLSEKAFVIASESEGKLEPSLLLASEPIKPGEALRVVSAVSVADEASLRRAGTDYPSWVTARYLQLPAELPRRVRELAVEIASRYDNPYDKVLAIERYLRENMVYNEKIPPPPEGVDAVDYFLFDLRQGYCNYYASAMVVMARALGIPARLAAGYTTGEYLAGKGRWRVREKHAHAWVEVFFPSYGWVEFEPTSAQPPIVRPSGAEAAPGTATRRERPLRIPEEIEIPEEEAPAPPEIPARAPVPPQAGKFARLWPLVQGLAALALALKAIWLELEPPELPPAARLYLRLLRMGRLAGGKPSLYQTPHEYAGKLARLLPDKAEALESLAGFYLQERFSPEPPDEEAMANLWKEIFPSLLLALLKQRRSISGGEEKGQGYDGGPDQHRSNSR